MANYVIPDNPVYDREIRKLEDSDPASATQTFNPLFQKIINNIEAIRTAGDISGVNVTAPLTGGGTGGTVTVSHATQSIDIAANTAAKPAFGGSFTVVGSASGNATGHVTAIKQTSVTIPSNTATASAVGLMSAADKAKLDGISAGAQINAVTSVNNKTGAVSLSAGDIGAASTAVATTTASGLMSAADKIKLNGLGIGTSSDSITSGGNSTKGYLIFKSSTSVESMVAYGQYSILVKSTNQRFDISFPTVFNNAPNVICTLQAGIDTNTGYGGCVTFNVSKTGFSVRCNRNPDSSLSSTGYENSVMINYIAIGR
ncbi:MAG: H-type lectin domain-containing protein [Eubacterium sp.]|jgi:hypothetical protein|nr:H-type lectin domain-containing protein [Eubacterium sp.]